MCSDRSVIRSWSSATAGRSSRLFSRIRPTWSSTSRKVRASAVRARPASGRLRDARHSLHWIRSARPGGRARQGHDAAPRWSRWASRSRKASPSRRRPSAYDGEHAEFPAILEEAGLSYPIIAKPTCEGSSKGIRNRCVVRSAAEFGPTIVELWQNYRQPVLVEEFIVGEEITIGIVGNDPPEPLGIMRDRPEVRPGDFYLQSRSEARLGGASRIWRPRETAARRDACC